MSTALEPTTGDGPGPDDDLWARVAAKLEGTMRVARDADSPGELACLLDPRTVQTPALELIDSKLVAVERGDITRLIISFSPQEGKSVRCSHYHPLWRLIRNPDLRLGVASYEQRIATRWGRAVRNTIKTHPELDLRVRDDTSAAHEWQLDGYDGGLYSVGLGGALTGRALDGLLIDDPVKDRAQAESQAYRDAAWDWWTDVARTRLAPHAFVVVIMTRWHENDLAGRLMSQDAEDWIVVNIPALADHRPEKGETDPLGREPGQWMVSARGRTPAEWEAIRASVGARTFASLYQGRPAPAEGTLFKREQWQRYDVPKFAPQPDGTFQVFGADEVIQSWDMAFKDTKASDWVVGQVWARYGLDAYLLTQVRGRWSFTETCRQVVKLAGEWPQARTKLVEDKANGTAVIDQLQQQITGLIPVTPTDGKWQRAVAVSPFVESRHVYIPADTAQSWVPGWVEELATFPNSSNDDQVDAATQALERLLGHPVKSRSTRPPARVDLGRGVAGAMGHASLGNGFRPWR